MNDTTRQGWVSRPALDRGKEALTHELRFARSRELVCECACGWRASHIAILLSQDTDEPVIVRDMASGSERQFG